MRCHALCFAVLSALAIGISQGAAAPRFPYSTCATNLKGRFNLLPFVTNEFANTFCFDIKENAACQTTTCCQSNSYKFVMLISAGCDKMTITATLDNAPLPAPVISRPSGAPANERIITISGLNSSKLTPVNEGINTILCIKLPTNATCNTLGKAAIGGANWTATLMASDNKCCPISRGSPRPAPPTATACRSCFAWDVVGPDGTAATTKFDFFKRNQCPLALESDPTDPFDLAWMSNCCQYNVRKFAYSQLFEYTLRDSFMYNDPNALVRAIINGFSRPVCDRTGFRLCGTVASPEAGQEMLSYLNPDIYPIFDLGYPEPLSAINSTYRVYTVQPASTLFDYTCMPYEYNYKAWTPPKKEKSFPSSSCTATPGVTPFTVGLYEEIQYGNNQTDRYCVSLGATTPSQPKSACGSTTSIARVSFWLRKAAELSNVYLQTIETSGAKVNKKLSYMWAPSGASELIIPNLGVDLSAIKSKKHKICFEVDKSSSLGDLNPSGRTALLWTALFDKSGRCCPTYYSAVY